MPEITGPSCLIWLYSFKEIRRSNQGHPGRKELWLQLLAGSSSTRLLQDPFERRTSSNEHQPRTDFKATGQSVA